MYEINNGVIEFAEHGHLVNKKREADRFSPEIIFTVGFSVVDKTSYKNCLIVSPSVYAFNSVSFSINE
jgi:hypothetical protein